MPARNNKGGLKRFITWIIFATNIVAIVLLFCSFLSWNVSTLKTNLFSYIGLGFAFIFFLNIAYLLFWAFFSKWKQFAICLIAIVLCYKPITTFFPINISSPKPPQSAIKILTYNVQGFISERNKDAVDHPILDYIAS